MSGADRYRHYAGECVRIAEHISDPAEKSLMLRMAETWLRLAERAESRATGIAGPPAAGTVEPPDEETPHEDTPKSPDDGRH
jgi:hypothetical protein